MKDLESVKLDRALARLLEAHTDLESAKVLMDCKIYSRSLYHSQQCVEKSLKACLTIITVGEIKTHTVAQYFQKELMAILPDEIKCKFENRHEILWIEERWVDTRYEEFHKGKIRLPSTQFSAEDAERGVKTAEKLLADCTDVVAFLFKKEIPNDFEALRKLLDNA